MPLPAAGSPWKEASPADGTRTSSYSRGGSVSRDDHIADPEARFFCVAFDRRGRLGWKKPVIEDDDPGYDRAHIIEVLCEDAKDEYLAWLRSVGISYIFAG